MKLKVIRCKICDYWYMTKCHPQCPTCGAEMITVGHRTLTIIKNGDSYRSIERGMPRDYALAYLTAK